MARWRSQMARAGDGDGLGDLLVRGSLALLHRCISRIGRKHPPNTTVVASCVRTQGAD
jgi:hypothetical protein